MAALVLAGGWVYFHGRGLSGNNPDIVGWPFNLPAEAEMDAVLPAEPGRATRPPSERVQHFDEALARAKATGNDIVVLQRGSDWNRLSEHVYQDIWSREPFFKSLGDGFILLAVDNQENPGAQPVSLAFPTSGDILTDTRADRDLPQTALVGLAAMPMDASACEITGVASGENVPYARQPDGSWKIQGPYAIPAGDTLTLELNVTQGGNFLRLDFPTDPSLPNKGPGTAPNGNAVLSEIEVEQAGAIVKPETVTASVDLGGQWAAATAINGRNEKGTEGWNMGGGKPVALAVSLCRAIDAGTKATVKLHFRSDVGQHIAGCLRAAVQTNVPDLKQAPPPDEIVSITSMEKIPFTPRPDGAYLSGLKVVANPAKDVLTLKLKPTRAGQILRLDFPLDMEVPNHGPGRAGNIVISEILVAQGGTPVAAGHAWSSNTVVDKSAASKTIDGITDKGDEGWNAQGGKKSARTLFLALGHPVGPGEVEVKLACNSQWAGHIPTCVKACIIADASLATAIAEIAGATEIKARNASYTWNDTTYCPRIALLDAQGRAVACDNKPRINLTARSLAVGIHRLRAVREQRDALWAKAAASQGVEKAALLADGIHLLRGNIGDTTGAGMWDGNNHCYKPVFEEIAKLDPKDDSWVSRILRCGADSRCGFATLEPAMRKAGATDYIADAADAMKEKNHDKALACHDAMIAHPNFAKLGADLKQRVLLAKFTVYRTWPGHEAEAIAMLREIIRVSGDTNLGKGAIGLLAFTFTDSPDNFGYGWGTKSIKPGDNTFNFIRGLDLPFRSPGEFLLQINRTAGNDTVKIQSVILRDGDHILAESSSANNELGPATPVLNIPIVIRPADWKATDRRLNLVVKLTGTPAKNTPAVDCGASFTVQRILADGTPEATIPAKDYQVILASLTDSLATNHDFKNAGVRLALAQREFMDACGPTQLNVMQERPGGAAMLAEYMNDVDWLETFLTSCPPAATFAASADNMRILATRCEGLKVPVYRRLATALSLSAGNIPRAQLIQAYNNYRNAHRDMLLYTDFEHLDVRGMREAIDFCSKEDFEFLQNDRQLTPASALGACWAVWYMDTSILGGNIQGGGYLGCYFYTPWSWTLLPAQGARFNGGVCGSLSSYGALCARINGIQSHPVGQPGHCAYVVRTGKAWSVGYYVGGPTGCGVPGWAGVGYNTANTLQEPIMQDRPAVLEAARHSWVAHVLRDAASPRIHLAPSWKYAVYENRGPKMPDFSKLTPLVSGTSKGISPDGVAPNPPFNTDFAATWEGEFDVPADCKANARISSFDEAQVFIDGQLLGTSSVRAPFARLVPMKSGKHAIRVACRAGGGRGNFELSLKPIPAAGAWQAAYQAAIAAQPANYGTWLEYLANLKQVENIPPETWKSLADTAAVTFKDDQEAAWALVGQCQDMLKPATKGEELMNLYLGAHKRLPYSRKYPHHFENLNLAGIINAQAAALGTPGMQLKFFENLLGIHFNQDPERNKYFGLVLDWGNSAFGRNPKLSGEYTAAIGRFFKSYNTSLDKNLMRNTIIAGIKNASETGDLAAYKLWNSLAKDFVTPDDPRWDLKIQGPINENYGQPFPGSLLSPDGLLQCSSPVSYLAFTPVQNAGQGSFFYVNKMKNPWLTLQLGGESELSGIVVLGHDKSEMPWKFSVSADNKSWTEVATIQTYEPGIRIDLQGKGIKAKYVKLERPADCPDNFIHLRNFLVYGKKLY